MSSQEEKVEKLLNLADEVINIREQFPKMYEQILRKKTILEIQQMISLTSLLGSHERKL
uniref:Uncharacterized protein n=1 Tax=Megaselia scalaris TaxID=36166 RepID=T1GZZ2_MEGSC